MKNPAYTAVLLACLFVISLDLEFAQAQAPEAKSQQQNSPLCVDCLKIRVGSPDAFLGKYSFNDPAHERLALIVRGADTSRLDLAPQCAGLYATPIGLSATFSDDDELLRHALVMYDALYTWCAHLQDETHGWPPAGYQLSAC